MNDIMVSEWERIFRIDGIYDINRNNIILKYDGTDGINKESEYLYK